MKKVKLLMPCFGHLEGTVLPLNDKDSDWAIKNKKAELVKETKSKK